YAPVMTVNYEYFDEITPDSAVELVKRLQKPEDGLPVSARGARLCGFKEMSQQLAGFPDERVRITADGLPGEPTLAGNRLAEQYGIAVSGFNPDTPIPSAHAQGGQAAGGKA
ncbi:MAG: NADH-quinone oxidoreductase subunit NuoE, partial [Micromonosporaceae bacterium]|nr:NADH-quinone oxidoreductase subunit NuoE [Micromonosporaceae bacterium]